MCIPIESSKFLKSYLGDRFHYIYIIYTSSLHDPFTFSMDWLGKNPGNPQISWDKSMVSVPGPQLGWISSVAFGSAGGARKHIGGLEFLELTIYMNI